MKFPNKKNFKEVHVFLKPILGVFLLIMLGALGYVYIEHWNLVDALFMSVMTLSTVGYEIVYPLSMPGIIFTIQEVGMTIHLRCIFIRKS